MKIMKNTTEENIGNRQSCRERGLRRENLDENELPLLFLVPLVETAWAHGAIARSEKQMIFTAAREEEIDEKHFLNETLDELLIYQPGQAFFDSCLALIKSELSAMTVAGREQKLAKLVNRCRRVAASAGGNSTMDIDNFTSPEESEVLARLVAELNFRDTEQKSKRREPFAATAIGKIKRIFKGRQQS